MSRTNNRQALRERLRKQIKQKAKDHTAGTRRVPLVIPDGAELWVPDTKNEYLFDCFLYEVTTDIHPDGVAKGDYWYARPFLVHTNIAGSGVDAICPTSLGQACPMCERVTKLRDDYEENEATIKDLRPTKYCAFAGRIKGIKNWVIFAWNSSKFAKHLDKELDEGELSNCDFPFAQGGKTLRIRIGEESYMGRPFLSTTRIDFEPRKDYPETIYAKVPKLDECLEALPYSRMVQLMLGLQDMPESYDAETGMAVLAGEEKSTSRDKVEEDEDKPWDEVEEEEVEKVEEDKDEPWDEVEKVEKVEEDEPWDEVEENEEEEVEEEELVIPPDGELCVACEGEKVNTKGSTCPICKGKGFTKAAQKAGGKRKEASTPKEEPEDDLDMGKDSTDTDDDWGDDDW